MPYQRSKIPNLKRVLTKAAEAAVETAQSGLVSYAQQQRDLFVRKIEEQKFASFRVIFYPESGTNLSPRWLARKAYKGADERTAHHATMASDENLRTFGDGIVAWHGFTHGSQTQ